jgi:hypothetical protein
MKITRVEAIPFKIPMENIQNRFIWDFGFVLSK